VPLPTLTQRSPYNCTPQVLQLKQKPHEGREYDKEKEDRQEHVSAVHACAQILTQGVCDRHVACVAQPGTSPCRDARQLKPAVTLHAGHEAP
jgi:hypothetical protein